MFAMPFHRAYLIHPISSRSSKSSGFTPVSSDSLRPRVRFNPIAPTLLAKALTSLLTKHFTLTPRSRPPTKDVVKMVVDSAHGDIRSAVMALQFACVVQLPNGKKMRDARSLCVALPRAFQFLMFDRSRW